MSNRIDATIRFSFKGENFSPSTTIDLDAMLEQHDNLPDLHQFLAQQSGIDTYSYLYEVMEAHDIEYTNATGLATDCLQDGHFDLARFEQLWHEARELDGLAHIAREQLGITDLNAEPKIKQALLEAYRQGQQAGR